MLVEVLPAEHGDGVVPVRRAASRLLSGVDLEDFPAVAVADRGRAGVGRRGPGA